MWIVYISISIVIVAVILLITSILKTLKTTRPTINSINHTMGSMQAKMNAVSREADQLKTIQGELQEDLNRKKRSMMFTVEEAKRTPKVVKDLANGIKEGHQSS
ncbi:hypothetical protein LCM10_02755 [Rossellomorea aquimaris]|uniref:DUF948 domain-containing protein n=1 Tax=Rossellomorea aquimaris TaxID=189382 RepID=UPI001CD55348|nr:DUF948 domain-containing protein [Rossellomorea aquimaris]MCA1053894.1 hypothetical protein [Rossellomorea aquimaris]